VASDYTKNKNNDRELRKGNKVHILFISQIIVQYFIYRVLKITNDRDKLC